MTMLNYAILVPPFLGEASEPRHQYLLLTFEISILLAIFRALPSVLSLNTLS